MPQELKKEHFYWKLNKQYSRCYYTSSPYRERITLLMNTKSQLSLNLDGHSKVVDVSVLADIHTLDLSNCNNISDVSLLGGVYKLNLTSCKNLDNVGALGQVHSLYLGGSNVVDVSSLGEVYTLIISGCRGIVNVSILGQVHELNLGGSNVLDVSALGGVHTLKISDCMRDPVQRRNLTYAARREGIFLAFRALCFSVEPTIWANLRHEHRDLLQRVISYL
jgi:hypothetical protein